jgi:UDP-glucuronate 4-epimerase
MILMSRQKTIVDIFLILDGEIMRILITGVAGFIGSALAKRFLAENNFVTGVDSFSDYYSTDLKEARIKVIAANESLTISRGSLTDLNYCKQILDQVKPDLVLHLAGQPGVRLPQNENYKYINDNIVAFTNILNESVRLKIPKFFYASSSSVYGNTAGQSLSENISKLHPVSLYGATKLSNEIIANSLASNTNTSVLGLRFFSVYGPWGRPDMAYFRLISNLISGTHFNLFGSGAKSRDFTFIDDVVESVFMLTNTFDPNSVGGKADVINIGGGNPHSINEMINILESIASRRVSFDRMEEDSKDVDRTSASIVKLKELVGVVPKTTLYDGLLTTYNWANLPEIRSELDNWVS